MTDTPLIFLVEDHPKLRASTLLQLRDEGYAADAVGTFDEALVRLEQLVEPPDLLLLDVRLGEHSGIDLFRKLAETGPVPPTIFVSGEASIDETVEALRLGVYDFIQKPFSRDRLLKSVRNALDHSELEQELARVRALAGGHGSIIGRSAEIEALRHRIAQVAPTDAKVLIRGESGTGKEMIAAEIHRNSSRARGPFIKINCAAIPAHLIEDELFGHAKGAFTDARSERPGLLEAADRGTLFLDEIGDMELPLQARLLRVLEDHTVRRIGESRDRKIDVRFVAATNRDLAVLIEEKVFRADLFFRLAGVTIEAPPLRSRANDIRLLFRHFLDLYCERNRRGHLVVSDETWNLIEDYHWPGNVRELRNLCESLAIFGTGTITPDQLPASVRAGHNSHLESSLLRLGETAARLPLKDLKAVCEREYIEFILRRTNWNFTRAAEILEIQRTYLHRKVKALDIEGPSHPHEGERH